MANDPSADWLVVVGASVGGIAALLEIAQALPPGFAAPVCIVQHVGAHPSILPELLSTRGRRPARHAQDGQLLTPGMLHVAPPDHHMLVEGRLLRLTRGPRENHTRPAVDPLFRSAARDWGPRTIGVVLTGAMDDGSAGLAAIKTCGGIAIVQDPATAEDPSMPQSALDALDVDYSVPLEEIAPLLARLVQQPPGPPPPETRRREAAISGVRALQERELLLRRMASVAETTGEQAQADAARRQADRLQAQVRDLLAFTASVRGEAP